MLFRSATAAGNGVAELPKDYKLYQNHPNPFNPTTAIDFALPKANRVELTVYNVLGNEVAKLVDGEMTAGHHSIVLDGADLTSGIYFYHLKAGEFTQMKKMVLMK